MRMTLHSRLALNRKLSNENYTGVVADGLGSIIMLRSLDVIWDRAYWT
jgi:hypothetical protein